MIIIKNDVYPSYVALSRFTLPRISTHKSKDGKTHYGKFDRGIFQIRKSRSFHHRQQFTQIVLQPASRLAARVKNPVPYPTSSTQSPGLILAKAAVRWRKTCSRPKVIFRISASYVETICSIGGLIARSSSERFERRPIAA